MRALCLLTFVLLVPVPTDARPGAAVRAELARLRADSTFSGVVLVQRRGEPPAREAFGLACAEWGVASAVDAVFPIGSLTKQFTALAVLLLERDGRLSLDERLPRFFPDAPPAWRAISVRQLLTHTSGIPDLVRLPEFPGIARSGATRDSLVHLLERQPLAYDPGSRFVYGNSGYVLAAAIIEELSGGTYAEFMRRNIFAPAGMLHSGTSDGATVIAHAAHGYVRHDGRLEHADFLDAGVPIGAGSEYSTVDDLARFDQALHGGRWLTGSALERIFTPQAEDYGFGWDLAHREGHRIHDHVGDINGFGAYMGHDLDDGVLVVVLCNVERTPVRAIGERLMAAAWKDAAIATPASPRR
jgi:CubicO group peptidase (beta-lactamase class C family)